MANNIGHTNIVPEVLVYNVLQGVLKYLRDDIQEYSTSPEKTILHSILQDIGLVKQSYLKEAIELFSRVEGEHPRAVDVRLFFDAKRALEPTVHITLAGDSSGPNSIGFNEEVFVYQQTDIVEGEEVTMTSPIYGRVFETSLTVVCTSSNHHEVLIMYHVLKSCIISVVDTLELKGFQNIKLTGKELQIREDLVPNAIFSRGITLNGIYEARVRRVFNTKKLLDIELKNTTPYTPD